MKIDSTAGDFERNLGGVVFITAQIDEKHI
jgi:hypothetical protein